MKIKSSNIACFRYGWIQELKLHLLSPHLSDLSFPLHGFRLRPTLHVVAPVQQAIP